MPDGENIRLEINWLKTDDKYETALVVTDENNKTLMCEMKNYDTLERFFWRMNKLFFSNKRFKWGLTEFKISGRDSRREKNK